MKRVLIISPHFPPINAPDMQRVRMSLPYYRALGWEPVVLTVDDACQTGVREPALLETLPPGLRIVRTRALPVRLCRRIGLGNLGLRALPFLLWRGARLLLAEKFDLVFISNTQFVTFTLGRLWQRASGVPYVIDLQDPWRTDFYERPGARRPPGGWKYQLARGQAWALEEWSLRRVAAMMSVSPAYLDDLRARYRFFQTVPTAVIGFGASPQDLIHARRLRDGSGTFDRSRGEIHFLYTGASGPVMPHSLEVLFGGLLLYRARQPARAARLRFHFIGTSYVARGRGVASVLPVAVACGVADQVEETPHRIGHLEALRWQMAADVLLLPGSSDLAYSPSKVYPYFLTGRPILGLVFETSVMERLLDDLGCAFMVRYREDGSKEAAHARLCEFFDRALENFPGAALPGRNTAFFDRHFLAEELTRRQCALFDRAVGPALPVL